jgi:hypothetical protein
MKIVMNKESITLAEVSQAEELRKEWKEYDNNLYNCLIDNAIHANSYKINPATSWCTAERVISIDKIEITKNHYQLTVWIEAIVKTDFDKIVLISFDGMQAMQYSREDKNKIDTYMEIYNRNK